MTATPETAGKPGIRSLIPARIDRLPWSKFHTRMVIALGVAWVLDGLEITIASNVGPDLTLPNTLHMSASGVADIATWYLIGEVIGALFFGHLSDKLGRKNLFLITLGVYLIGSGLTAATPKGGSWFIFLYLTRVIAGMGIGGEYAAINSAIDEMIPARFRGRVDIAVNGTYWAGAFLGTIITLVALNHIAPAAGLASRLRGRPGARPGDHLRPAEPAGKPSLAGHARPRARSRGVYRRDRGRGQSDPGQPARGGRQP